MSLFRRFKKKPVYISRVLNLVDVAAEGIWGMEINRNNSKYIFSKALVGHNQYCRFGSRKGAKYTIDTDAPQQEK